MNNMKMEPKLKVYYDGLCMVCNKEITHYRKQAGSETIEFINICAPGFNAVAENLDPLQVHKVMHVRRLDGSLATRVEAFIEIWKTLPRYKRLAKIAENSIVRSGLDLGYTCFAKIRPWLPRYRSSDDCKDSPYCDLKNS